MASLWNWFQHLQIRDNHQRSATAQIDARYALRQIDDLEAKVDSLALLCHALFEELQTVTGMTEAQLKARMTEIDLRDGMLDGKYAPQALATCPECGHKVKSNRPNCFWCGAKLAGSL